jgi:CPA2 family monovalent cation:H+ antiporter-2
MLTPALLASAEPNWIGLDLMVLLSVAAVVAWLFQRLRLEAIPGYLLAGVAIGPNAMNLIRGEASIEQMSSIAVTLLMFGIGLQLDLNVIRRGMVHILAIGVVSTALFVLGSLSFKLLMGVPAPVALLGAFALSASSTAVLVRVVQARREGATVHSRVGLGISIVQDLACVIFLAMIPVLASWHGVGGAEAASEAAYAKSAWLTGLPKWLEVAARAGLAAGGIGLLILVGKKLLPRVLDAVAGVGSSELMLIVSAAIALVAAVFTSAIGLSAEMGAFLAGFMLAATPYRFQISGLVAPIRDVLMAVFFVSVGLKVDPIVVVNNWWLIGLAALMVISLKVLFIAGSGWALGMTLGSAFICAGYLANAGEFSLVLLSAAQKAGLVTSVELGNTIAVCVLTLIATPLLAGPVHRIADRLRRVPQACIFGGAQSLAEPAPAPQPGAGTHDESTRDAEAGPHAPTSSPGHPTPHAIIAGFGPVGRALADRFEVLGIPYTVVELNPRTVSRQGKLGRTVIYGDVTNPEVLESAGLPHAMAVLLTVPDDETNLRACRVVRSLAPDVFIAARTSFLSGSFAAMQLGADVVTVEEVATASAMERDVLGKLPALAKPFPKPSA